MVSLVSDYAEHADDLIDPSYSYVIRNIQQVQNSYATIEGPIVFKSSVIARLLEQCGQVAVFLTTIGGHLEEMVSQLSKDGFMLQASVLDAIGSSAAEKMAESVQRMIMEESKPRGLYISQRFSPGYCDWNVKQQKEIFQAMNGDFAGIRLTSECLMLPRKSISGIIGIGPRKVTSYNPCKT